MASSTNISLRNILLLLFPTLLFLIFIFNVPPTTYVRLDSGDISYCYFHIPIRTRKLPEPDRSLLIALAKTSAKVSAKWVWIENDTQHGTTYMCQDMFEIAAAWSHIDPTIARFIMEDHVDYIQTQHWQGGLPKGVELQTSRTNGIFTIPADWKQDEAVLGYCHAHNYTPPSTTLSATAPK